MEPSFETGLHEECGVLGIFDPEGGSVSRDMYYGLSALQHRGQESCGIATTDTFGPKGIVTHHKGLGLVNEVFHTEILENLKGNLGVGHVRYSTTGSSNLLNAQPLVLKYIKGTLCLAHNGNLVNTYDLRNELVMNGAVFQTTIDSEVIAYHIARERVRTDSVEAALKTTARKLLGAYALVISSPRKLIGLRDPYGFRPLCLGKKGKRWILASESCAITSMGGEFLRDVEPGEMIIIDKDGSMHSDFSLRIDESKHAHCIFEYIYFARLDSKIDGLSVYDSRIIGGRTLARSYPVDADLVAGVPDSGLAAAMGYAEESGIPFKMIFHKNSYVGRTFIKPTQEEREMSVKIKLNVLEAAVKGKRIILIDDSIVRGTTIKNLIKILKADGAKEVHVRICAPPFLHPCYFGTDVPSNNQLIASTHSVEEIRAEIGADSLGFMKTEDLTEMSAGRPICTGCFTGVYPFNVPESADKNLFED